jgi:hypothetical protein
MIANLAISNWPFGDEDTAPAASSMALPTLTCCLTQPYLNPQGKQPFNVRG